ncbi:DUF3310 domain-containing protein [Brevibacterium album]|uniref:DUF3310 domain-containing protein n=1 Tax=Brevibacterium album TaxID=417948 RepID=UPI001B7FC7C7|nr:DUF3310 domain-containing protein [Brevibacterium album]
MIATIEEIREADCVITMGGEGLFRIEGDGPFAGLWSNVENDAPGTHWPEAKCLYGDHELEGLGVFIAVNSEDPAPDMVTNPPHYTDGRSIEPISVIEDWGLGYHTGNALKYISRAGRKSDEIQDLEKAVWYLNRRIAKLRGEAE